MREKQTTRGYRSIVAIELRASALKVTFLNGDIVTLEKSRLMPPGFRNAKWPLAEIITEGLAISVPAEPRALEIPWYTIRSLTDKEFSQYWVTRAEQQAQEIGRRLRLLREQRGLKQAYVADTAGLQAPNLSRIENGHFDIASSTLWKILAAMGCSFRDLVEVEQ